MSQKGKRTSIPRTDRRLYPGKPIWAKMHHRTTGPEQESEDLKELGFLGGTFDPPHKGHLHLARVAQKTLGLDGVFFVPCNRQPLKRKEPVASSWHRCAMLALAIQGAATWRLSTIEVERGGISYTAETLRAFGKLMPGVRWTLLMGADGIETLSKWRDIEAILLMSKFAFAARERGVNMDLPREFEGRGAALLKSAPFPASSSSIRNMIFRGERCAALLPPRVREYIDREGLYRGD